MIGLGISRIVGNLIEARSIMTFCVPLILIETCFETIEAFQIRMTVQDLIDFEYRIFIREVRNWSDVASVDKEKKVGG